MRKGIIFVLIYGVMVSVAFVYRELVMEWLNHSDLSQLPFMFALAVIFGVIPVVPFSVFAGLMGVKYGVILGTAINWTGSVGAAAIIFLLARYFFVETFQHFIAKNNKIKKFDDIIHRNAFVAVFFVRLIPIVPPPVVNIYSGLSPMLFGTYFLATAIGKIPGTLMYAYLGNQLFTSIPLFIMGIVIYIAFILVVVVFYRKWNKARAKAI
ncbi:TVP38/TMEM64 family protein [Fredinandcohnia sp. 179-A 10B2 NHS]|uniref:TVP38/TMEM64 family protein n=1 Tax=Fredinandcohnia sp. 179-A 10B2 NHS TaxID=3235176 RepID=UPI00399FF1E6